QTDVAKAEGAEVLHEVNHLTVCVQVNDVDRKQHADGVNTLRRNHPQAFAQPYSQPSQQTAKSLEGGSGTTYIQSQERFARFVKSIVSLLHFHSGPPERPADLSRLHSA